jgi:peptidoglycan hydrolase-like protein with peptidoglycan-binding domain
VATNRDLSSPVPWRRSLRASRARRAARARRRRLALRGRAGITLAVALSVMAAGGALAQDAATPPAPGVQSTDSVRALQKKLGVKADGVYGPRTRAAVKRFQRANGLDVDGIAGPQTLAALGLAGDERETTAQDTTTTSSVDGDPNDPRLEGIAQCESGGDPTAVSADGTYRGKYQFSRATWRAVGGRGNPARASEAEQDRRARILYRREGTAPWPVCGGA